MAASSLSAAASSGTSGLSVPSPSRLLSPRCFAVRMPFVSSTPRLVYSASSVQARRRRLFVAPQAPQTKSQEVNEQEGTAESDSDEFDETDDSDLDSESDGAVSERSSVSGVESLLKDYREALSNDQEASLAEIESKLKSIEVERDAFAKQVSSLNAEVSAGKERLLRLNADFENFRKRSEKDRIAVGSNVKGDVVKSLLPMVDNFERAKSQIKTETEGEQRIDSSYQGIYKQFVEIMKGLGVSVVETVGKEFDPNIHEAIMREESSQYAEGVVIEEFRRGFLLGDKLLRPSMVKVSSGSPAPVAPEPAVESESGSEVEEKVEEAPLP